MKNKNKKGRKWEKGIGGNKGAVVLASVLGLMLLLEGALFTLPTSQDWRASLEVFDTSLEIKTTAAFAGNLFQPVADVVDGVNKFYQTAANEMYFLLEGDNFSEVGEVYSINGFYASAADEMIGVLDFSGSTDWISRVAGVSIEK